MLGVNIACPLKDVSTKLFFAYFSMFSLPSLAISHRSYDFLSVFSLRVDDEGYSRNASCVLMKT
jgi:hypothetical protein